MLWTLSNRLTMTRVLLIPALIAAFYLPADLGYWSASMIFAVASATDWLDGYLARRRNEVTPFGRFLDPVADKLIVATALVLLVADDRCPALLAVIIIGREITIGALREWLAERANIIHVSMLAKWKTALQMIAITALLLHRSVAGVSMHDVGIILLWLAAALTLWSAYEYMRDAWGELVPPTSRQAPPAPSPSQAKEGQASAD
ncbi:MAG: CDP-diacylglycerol--glycerol-3-phosphate 3-phosphatidyltransferase [Zetaproteobacteria bacterium]|nr:MAG: CDP-diacylglycerol--glycerol-3-phosphate 3-phosphatidyltransferase [Zetaproteobacteria bacterium]